MQIYTKQKGKNIMYNIKLGNNQAKYIQKIIYRNQDSKCKTVSTKVPVT